MSSEKKQIEQEKIIVAEVESAKEIYDRIVAQAGEESYFEMIDGYFEFAGLMVDELRRKQTFLEDQIETKDALIADLIDIIKK